jgi:hypothetical protein
MPQNKKKRSPKRGPKSAKSSKAKASKAGKVKFGDKARFVKAQPVDMPASQVIALAAEQGIPLSENHVYNTRKLMREKDEQGTGDGIVQAPNGKKDGASIAGAIPGIGKAQWINTFKSAVFFLGHEESVKVLEEMREHHAASVIT